MKRLRRLLQELFYLCKIIDLSSVLTFLNYIERFSLHNFNHDIVKQTGEAGINNIVITFISLFVS